MYALLAVVGNFCSSDQSCSTFELMGYVARSLILLGAIVSINFTIAHIRSSLHVSSCGTCHHACPLMLVPITYILPGPVVSVADSGLSEAEAVPFLQVGFFGLLADAACNDPPLR
jgi:hypothetical protein